MIAGMLHGVLVIWRRRDDAETIYDWGIYQLFYDEAGNRKPFDPHPLGYIPEIICEERVPLYGSPGTEGTVITRQDFEMALPVLQEALVNRVRTDSTLQRIKDQFGRIAAKGKPKPKVEIVEQHDFERLLQNAINMPVT